jgi:phosphate transport system substrate-binding protein
MKMTIWMKAACIMLLLIGLMMSGTGCGPGKTSITMAGSTAFQPFAEKLAEQYMNENPGVNITVQGGGSAVGVQSALSGAAQIGMADLVNLPDEAKPLTATVVARDGISIVVHPSNPVEALGTDQIRKIFNGEIRNWKEMGGRDGVITVVSREAGSGTRSSFEQIIKDIHQSADAIIQDSNGTIRETVANDPNAVGYLSHGLLNEKIKSLRIDEIECSVQTIKNGKYTLVRPVLLLTRGKPEGAAADFIGYILSPAGQKTIETSGLIGVQ